MNTRKKMVSKKEYKALVAEHFPKICKFYALMMHRNGEGVWKGEYKARMNEHIAVLRDNDVAKDSKSKLIARFREENGYDTVENLATTLGVVLSEQGVGNEFVLGLCESLINNLETIMSRIETEQV